MAKGPQYNVPFRRRREGRTDYRSRRRLVISGIPRLVIRPSNKNVTVQLIKAEPAGDDVMVSAQSSELKALGWKAACGNMPAAYLTGLLIGTRAKAKGVGNAIVDIGLSARGPGSRIFAVAKGALDGGLAIPIDKKALPSEDRLHGSHIVSYSKLISTQPEVYKKRFSRYLKNNLKPEDLQENFASVQAKITTQGATK
ncbi:MAG: 50S ribosomal protein L18 [Candidatus Bathyarchaeia archaeon]